MLITDVRYFKPEVVTAIFRANDIIAENEEVSKLTKLQSTETREYKSHIFAVQYKDFRTQRHAPDHIQLKISFKAAKQAKREIDFYERIMTPMKRRIAADLVCFPTCYDNYYDELSEQFHIILDDFSKEFKAAADKTPPTARHREQVIDTLAILHSYWWEHPLLEELATLADENSIATMMDAYQGKLTDIKKSVGKYLDVKYVSVLEKIAGGLPAKRKERLLTGKGLTVIHNQLTPENILYSVREAVFVNWEHWTVGINTDDLAMMIPFNWTSQLRQFQEKPLLKRYYDTLIKRGASDYSWEDFDYNYKASLAHIIATMLHQWTLDEHTRGHWRIMESAMDSFLEMGGESVLS